MAEAWYYAQNNQQFGPASRDVMQQLLQSGKLQPSDLVWAEGMPQWVPASTVSEFAGQGPVATPVTASPLGYRTPGMMGGTPPKSYLAESIAVTICCCQPFGIVGIVFAAQVNAKFNSGDVAGAYSASETAKKWITWGFGIGLLIDVLYILGAISGRHH